MKPGAGTVRRRLLAPEVIQVSAMDCGPAALACLLRGFGIPADYARLRQACQTDVDGTSIDRVEEVAVQLGLVAEQVMVPVDHVLRDEAGLLPAVAVVLLPGDITHFAVAWRKTGPLLQVMDPGSGRHVTRPAAFLQRLYVHQHAVAADDWREWAASPAFLTPLTGRLRDLGVAAATAEELLQAAQSDPEWRWLAALDAATRLTAALVRQDGVRPGPDASLVLAALARQARQRADVVPTRHWSVLPGPDGSLWMRGAVLVRVRGRRPTEEPAPAVLPPSLSAAVAPRPVPAAKRLLSLLRAVPRPVTVAVAAAAALAAAAAAVEVLLLNGLLHSGLVPLAPPDHLVLVLGVAGFTLVVLGLDVCAMRGAFAIGRRLEAEFRMALLAKLPRIADRHLGTWLRSDLAHRAHAIAVLRELPLLAVRGLRAAGEIVITAAALAVLYEGAAAAAISAALVTVVIPVLAHPLLAERHIRLRSLEGALSGHYIDALMGGTAARAHAAEGLLRREHAAMLKDWEHAGHRLQRALVATDVVQSLAGLGFAALVIVPQVTSQAAGAGTLLLAFWALRLPALGAVLASVLERFLGQRTTLLRLLEPLDAPEEETGGEAPALAPGKGCSLSLKGVSVMAGGHTVLRDVELDVAAGEHVAVIGPSGAGKSTLLGLLLGWHTPAMGRRLVEGMPLDGEALSRLRERTAWVDPSVRLWNRSVITNLLYGSEAAAIPAAVEDASLRAVIDALPAGIETALGEEGRMLSGGEGQKVRTARAFGRPDAALVVLDEAFRGLERPERKRLLERARARWRHATMLCATHDLEDTAGFDRVVVMDGGRIVETGPPSALHANGRSRYASMLEAYAAVRESAWGSRLWRRLHLDRGSLKDTP